MKNYSNTISIAPMMDITNDFFRYFIRLLSKHAILYTQMIHSNTLIHATTQFKQRFLYFHQSEHPIVLQLGGNQPEKLALCAQLGQKWGYDQINLNVGCPSQKVQSGVFGACLMKSPNLVAQIMKKMSQSVNIPCTVKCRLGIDNLDSYQFLHNFVDEVSKKGNVKHFIIHARKAILKGLKPHQNRSIPPLDYQKVYKLKTNFPDLQFTINGGFKTVQSIRQALERNMQGVMIGRIAYQKPAMVARLDEEFYSQKENAMTRLFVLQVNKNYKKYGEYVQKVKEKNPKVSQSILCKPIINLMHGEAYSNLYRNLLSTKKQENSFLSKIQLIINELQKVNPNVLNKPL